MESKSHRLSQLKVRFARQKVRRSSGCPTKRGQSLIEFAFISPVFLLILLGTIDLGRMYADYVDLKSGAREGAGYGIVAPTDYAGMQSRVLAAGVPSGTTAAASCTGSCSSLGGTGTVVVTASSTFAPVTLGFFKWLGTDGKITLTATATMRVLS